MAESAGTVKLTKAFVERAATGAAGTQRLYWDTELPGFGLRVGASSKAFIVQRAVRGTARRVTVGRYGVLTVDEARAKARKLIARTSDGVDPTEEARQEAAATKREAELALTLRDAWDLYRGTLTSKRGAPRTIARYEHCLTHYLADWLDRPLRDITRTEARQRHQQLARDVAAGRYAQRVPDTRKHRRGAAGRARPAPGHLIVPRAPSGPNPPGNLDKRSSTRRTGSTGSRLPRCRLPPTRRRRMMCVITRFPARRRRPRRTASTTCWTWCLPASAQSCRC